MTPEDVLKEARKIENEPHREHKSKMEHHAESNFLDSEEDTPELILIKDGEMPSSFWQECCGRQIGPCPSISFPSKGEI